MLGRVPSLGGATGWLNSEPLGPAELRGRVALVNFWTLTCINWLRREPYVRAWAKAVGLVKAVPHELISTRPPTPDGSRATT